MLVLDDYHVIDASDVQDGMTFLLDHLPPALHVVIASRADPALPLARWRARGELVEARAAELRFTPDEAAAYLDEIMGLQLTAQDVAALEARTEGWIAALQLAALSMQGRDDVAGFIAGFAGDDRYVVDYLAEEVLQRQPDRVQAFLLQTSILGRLSGPLCDAVTGQGGSKATLEALDRGTCSWSRWMTAAGGTAITICLLTCCRRGCSTSGPARCRACTGGRARGTSRTVSRPRRSATRWPPGISAGRRTWSSWRSRPCAGAGRRPRCAAGSRRFPTRWSASGPYSASGMPGRCWLSASSRALRPGCVTPNGAWAVQDPQPHRRRWPSTTRNFAASRRGSSCTVPPWPWLGAMCPAPYGTPGGRSIFRLRRTTLSVLRQRACRGSRPGRAGISRQGTRRMPNAWRDYGGPGTLPISSAARSRWRIYAVRKVVSARRCAPTSGHCRVRLSRAGRCCGERQTCTLG